MLGRFAAASLLTMWIAYLAMATALFPLLCMGVGYLLLPERKRDDTRAAGRR